jgi:hypothetical protein
MRAGWVLGGIVTAVLGFAGVCQTGLLGSHADSSPKLTIRQGTVQDVISTEAGWRYQRGQPSHWKYLMMNK